MHAVGLKTHIWNNAVASVLLLTGFPLLVLAICYAFAILFTALDAESVGAGLTQATRLLPRLLPWALGITAVWFAIAWAWHQFIIDAVTGARPVTRQAEPRLYNLLENLCISRGLTMPALRVIETDARNAFASGIRDGRYSVTVTRGLVESLDDAELEAVLAHELTHIRNGDVRLLVIAAIFVGVISLVGDLLLRIFSAASRESRSSGGWIGRPRGRSSGGSSRGGGSSSDRKGNGFAILVLILIAIAIFLVARVLAIVLRLALSRRREYMADAGAVELTKNADAMISALHKIEGRSEIPGVPAEVREMFLDNPTHSWFEAVFATHPSIDKRIRALVQFAGGHGVELPAAPQPATPQTAALPAATPRMATPQVATPRVAQPAAATSFLHPNGSDAVWPARLGNPAGRVEP